MRSIHVDDFNHDEWAPNYDQNVKDESNPIRAGYEELLAWVAKTVGSDSKLEILELGSGSGNLSEKFKCCKRMVGVDISTEMEAIALTKTGHLRNRKFIHSDILQVFEKDIGTFDAIVSTYTIHHLVENEKWMLFQNIEKVLSSGGVAVFGDLMFENEDSKRKIIQEYASAGRDDIVRDIHNEFFWDVEKSIDELKKLGFDATVKRFSTLSFGLLAKKTA